MGITINLNVYNFKQWLGKPPQDFDDVRFDANNNCNIHCVYCGNPRSDDLIPLDEFRSFLSESVASVKLFQFGCQMEPTLDTRLCELMSAVAQSPAKPKKMFRLQTNAILLHRHDHARMQEAGLNFLTVSMDSIDSETFKRLRGGTSLNKVYRNIRAFHNACPAVRIAFVTVVTSANIDSIDALIESGLESGVGTFNLRQVVYNPYNPVVDHSLMPNLVVSHAEFSQMTERVRARYGDKARFSFLDAPAMRQTSTAVRAESLLPPLSRGPPADI
jgi:molybdenum cofactor biosynthesis enzyme MoaA